MPLQRQRWGRGWDGGGGGGRGRNAPLSPPLSSCRPWRLNWGSGGGRCCPEAPLEAGEQEKSWAWRGREQVLTYRLEAGGETKTERDVSAEAETEARLRTRQKREWKGERPALDPWKYPHPLTHTHRPPPPPPAPRPRPATAELNRRGAGPRRGLLQACVPPLLCVGQAKCSSESLLGNILEGSGTS